MITVLYYLGGSRPFTYHDGVWRRLLCRAIAKARAKQQLDKGRLSESQYSRIIANADRKVGGK